MKRLFLFLAAAAVATACASGDHPEETPLKPRIVVLTEDGIVEEGSHDELLKQDGIYASMYNLAL